MSDAPVAVRGAIGVVFQESALDRTLSVENLRFSGFLYGPRQRHRRARRRLLELFGLTEMRGPVGSLSGGQRRALDIVRGVMHRRACSFSTRADDRPRSAQPASHLALHRALRGDEA